MSDLGDLLRKLHSFEIPVTLQVGFLTSEIGTLIPDEYWEGDDVLVSLASLLEETARTIRQGLRERGGQ